MTLHCGLGNFREIDVEDLTKHKMDSEEMFINGDVTRIVNQAKDNGHQICVVGTSVMRAVETAVSTDGHMKEYEGWTNKFIFPPYEFSLATSMITNFHMPLSTLLMMTASFGGYELVMDAYDIALKEGVISSEKFPELEGYKGNDIITSDGTTVLGADDKAGVAEIMALAEYLTAHPEIRHGRIGIAFTPDEEIGHGAALFDVNKFGCRFAYTVDGEELGEISYETFNGASFEMCITGVNIHPGQAKGRMINAVAVANDIISEFPKAERPETTEGREGYYFIMAIEGGVEKCVLHGIIRDHDGKKFEERKQFVRSVAEKYSALYGGRVSLTLKDQYRNCADVIVPHMHLVENVQKAMREEGVEPITQPIRGGTDGSQLSYMGLPCPNICTGGRNAHGLNEFIAVQDMEKVVEILLRIVCAYAK